MRCIGTEVDRLPHVVGVTGISLDHIFPPSVSVATSMYSFDGLLYFRDLCTRAALVVFRWVLVGRRDPRPIASLIFLE